MGLAPVNMTYKGSDAVTSWHHKVMQSMDGTTSSISDYAPSYPTTSIGCPSDPDENLSSFSLLAHPGGNDPEATETDSDSDVEPESGVYETHSDGGHDLPIEVDLTIHVPPDVIEDDHALALVQVVPPDADISDVPETWDIYDLDFAGGPPEDREELDGPYDGQYDYKEDSTLDPYTSGDYQEEIYDEPGEGSYYSDGPSEGHSEPNKGSYYSDSPDEGSYPSDPDEGRISRINCTLAKEWYGGTRVSRVSNTRIDL